MESQKRRRDGGPVVFSVLEGVRVLDLSALVMGPLAAQMLGEMGAQVIKVEPPEGDLSRIAGPARNPGMSSLFMATNRNKRSIVLDLKQEAARCALYRLIEASDVLIHSTRTASLAALGLRYEDVEQINPGIVYCHVKGFSDDGAYGGQPAFDDMIQALSGAAALQASIDGSPRFVPMFLADKTCGVHAAFAIAAALVRKALTGEGARIDLGMFETMTGFNMLEHLWGETFEPPLGDVGYPSLASGLRRPQRTRDGYVSLWPVSDAQWHRFFELIGRPDLSHDEEINTLGARTRAPERVLSLFNSVMPDRTSAEWVRLCQAQDLPIAIVNSLGDLLHDPHLDSIAFWQTSNHPTEGKLRTPSLPYRLWPAVMVPGHHAPSLDEHGEQILEELGFSNSEILAIRNRSEDKC